MRIQRVTSEGLESPGLVASKLPPQIVDRAVAGLCWISLFTAVTSILLTVIEHVLQPEFAKAWTHPILRIATLFMVFLSVGFIVVQRTGWLRKEQLLYLGLFFQVTVAFCCALFEGAAYENPNMVVLGHSGIAVWMMLCGLLMPNAPLRTAIGAVLCVLMWPLGYWVDLQIFGYQPMPLTRLMVWVLPLVIVGFWMCIFNKRVLSFYVRQERAEDVGSYVLDAPLGTGGMGEVWRAKHRMLARQAAIKLIRPQALQSSTGRQESLLRRRFEREAQATASLSSPHTVALYDFGLTRDGVLLLRHGIVEGNRSPEPGGTVRTHGAGARASHSLPGLPVAGRSARRGTGPPRYQAPQHHVVPNRAGVRLHQGAGFRPREIVEPRAAMSLS